MKNHVLIAACMALAGIFLYAQAANAAVTCTTLARDLSRGSSDSTTGGEVFKLQTYLKELGYLSAAPNGNFGPATTVAVKSFQSTNKITATGSVGPITRLAIQVRSCTPAAPVSTGSPVAAAPVAPATSADTSPAKRVFAPSGDMHLVLGQVYLVAWEQSGSQNVILEDKDGISQGFITSSLAGLRNYSWKVGTVYSTKTDSEIVVNPGTYRIRVRGVGMNDQVSEIFSIDSPPLSITSLFPSQMAADGVAVGVLYGKGFSGATAVYVDDRWGIPARKLYVSPDSKVLVFSLSPAVSVGTHWIIVDDGYGTNINAGSVTITSSP